MNYEDLFIYYFNSAYFLIDEIKIMCLFICIRTIYRYTSKRATVYVATNYFVICIVFNGLSTYLFNKQPILRMQEDDETRQWK